MQSSLAFGKTLAGLGLASREDRPLVTFHAVGDRGDFWAQPPVEILVFASPTGHMLTSSAFPSLNWDMFYKFL